MNGLPDPGPADKVSEDVLSPCLGSGSGETSLGPAGPTVRPPLPSAPADLPIVGLRLELIELARELVPLVAYIGDMARWRTQPTTIDLCHWLDALALPVERVESHALLLRHMIDVLRDLAIEEGMRRNAAHPSVF